jgi:uncharacterized protein YjiS (DUF1127 family)
MPTYNESQQRTNTCTAQTYCDKRTLATLAIFFKEQRGYVLSMSELIRLSLELLEDIVIENGASEVKSTEDADDLLKQEFKANMHPSRRTARGETRPRMHYSFRKQIDVEDAFIEDREPVYNRLARGSVIDQVAKNRSFRDTSLSTPEQIDDAVRRGIELMNEESKDHEREFRTPDNVETLEQAEKRRKRELDDVKAGLAGVPADIITNSDADSNANNNDADSNSNGADGNNDEN